LAKPVKPRQHHRQIFGSNRLPDDRQTPQSPFNVVCRDGGTKATGEERVITAQFDRPLSKFGAVRAPIKRRTPSLLRVQHLREHVDGHTDAADVAGQVT
jgi:hypothetical protein